MASGEAAGALSRHSMKTDLFQRFDAWKQLRAGMWVSRTFQDLSRYVYVWRWNVTVEHDK